MSENIVFKTWEELRMLAQMNPAIDEAVTKIHFLSEEDSVREQMEAWEEYYKIERSKNAQLQSEKERNIRLVQEGAEKDKALAEKDKALAEKDRRIAELEKMLKSEDVKY
ncbi:MAG: hypothetical protein K6B44_04540 [Lachnospiraceae bacterium]|nr:hypothetical protein [Lachnospiraceae bacterium]